jgi:hypothetical protein
MSRAARLLPKLKAMAKDPSVSVEERHCARMKVADLLRKNPELEVSPEPLPPEQGRSTLPLPAYLEQILLRSEDLAQKGERLKDQIEDWLDVLDSY